MSPRESQPDVQIEGTVDVEHMKDKAKAVAVEINKIERSSVYLSTSAPTKAPSEESLAFYLEQIKEKIPPEEGASPAVQRLWNQPFCAKVPGSAATDLYDEVRRIFEQDRKLKRIQRVVILADAGMGKTPALYYLRMKRARHSLRTYRSYLTRKEKGESTELKKTFIIPLFIRLGDLRIGLPITTLVCDTFNACIPPEDNEHKITLDQAHLLLEERTCLIFFDDLDELFSEHHKGGVQAVSQFMETHPRHQFVISCRKSSYREQLGYLDELYLDDLTEGQVEQVLREALDDEHLKRLDPSLRELAQNRAMLNVILYLLDKDKSKLLDKDRLTQQPVNRGQLLQRRNRHRLGLKKSDSFKDLARLEMEEELLERLAYAMQRDHTRSYSERQVMVIVREYLEEWHERCTWREVAARLRDTGILKRDEMRQWHFSDRDAVAYFAAAAVLHDPAFLEPILEEVSDLWWRDVLEILIGLQQEPTNLFFELIDRDALVAAHCIHSAGRAVDSRMEDALIDTLLETMGQESSARRKYIVERIGESEHPRAPEALLRVLDREWSSLVVMAIAKALWRWEGDEPVLRWAHQSPESAGELFRKYAVPLSGKNEAKLAELMRDPEQPKQIRGISAVFLGVIGADDARSGLARRELLKLLVDQDVDDYVGWCVVEALTQIDHQDVQDKALSLYQDQKYRDKRWKHHRARAVYLLGWVSRRLATDKLLIEALKDPNPLVRCYAVDAMARLDLPNAREQIERLLTTEQDPKVLRKAGKTLGRIGTIDSISVLKTYLRHERTRTRWMIRRAIAEIQQRYAL